MTIGMTGDLLRGAKPIGLDVAIPFSESALMRAVQANPGVRDFKVYVNRFATFMAEQIVSRARAEALFTVVADDRYAKDSWRIEPVGAE